MRALADGGVLAVTIWNKEEPPKSVLKLYATMAAASRALDGDRMADSFFVASSYLSTATVLYKRGGFSADEIAALRKHSHDLSFDEIYSPGLFYDGSQTDRTLSGYVAQFFSTTVNGPSSADNAAAADPSEPDDASAPGGGGKAALRLKAEARALRCKIGTNESPVWRRPATGRRGLSRYDGDATIARQAPRRLVARQAGFAAATAIGKDRQQAFVRTVIRKCARIFAPFAPFDGRWLRQSVAGDQRGAIEARRRRTIIAVVTI